MAGLGKKTFTAGEVLTASDVNGYLMDQSVMVFGGTAARSSAIPTPTEGMMSYRTDDNVVEVFDGSAYVGVGGGKILQVVNVTKTDTFTTTSTSFVDVTGLTVNITPSSATSKILVLATVSGNGQSGVASLQGQLVRDSTAIAIGDAAGSRTRVSFGNIEDIVVNINTLPIMFLDSPATTSALTYKIQVRSNVSGQTVVINRSFNDADSATNTRGISTITLMEVDA